MSSAESTTDLLLSPAFRLMAQYLMAVVAQTTLYGIYLILFSVAFYNYMKRRATRLAIPFSAITGVTFAFSTFIWSSNVVVVVVWFRIACDTASSKGVFDQQSRLQLSDTSTITLRYMTDVMFVLSYLIGDTVIAWRIIMLSQRSIGVSVTMVSLWAGALGTGLALIGCLISARFKPAPGLLSICTRLENSSWVLSLVFNSMATLFLARLAWVQHQSNRAAGLPRSRAERVLQTLVVSGIVYLALGLPRLMSFANPSLNPMLTGVPYGTLIIEAMLYQVVGLYPTAVSAFLFYEGKTLKETSASLVTSTVFGDRLRRRGHVAVQPMGTSWTVVTIGDEHCSSVVEMLESA